MTHVNTNSIRNKIDLLSAELSNYYDIIFVSKTKPNDTVKTSDLEIDGFRMPLRKDRQINNGGGLMIYIKNNLCFKRRTELESNDIENIWIEINSLKNKLLVGLLHRPPNSQAEYWESFDENTELVTDLNTDMIIMGDFNQDILKTDKNNIFLRTLIKYNLKNLISEPTRITSTSATCLDLIKSLLNYK